MTEIPARLLDLLRRPSTCLIATTNPDGSPQLTQTWVDTDGDHVVINTVQGFRKLRNIERDPRVAISILDPDDPSDYYSLKGTVVKTSTDGGRESIEQLAQKYTGAPYQQYGGPGQVRVVMLIQIDRIIHAPWG